MLRHITARLEQKREIDEFDKRFILEIVSVRQHEHRGALECVQNELKTLNSLIQVRYCVFTPSVIN